MTREEALMKLSASLQVAHDEAMLLPGELGAIKTRVTNRLRLEINFVNSIAGITTTGATNDVLPEITSILGEDIVRRPALTPVDLAPTDIEKEKFLADRDNLFNQFLTLKNEQVYTKSKMPGGEATVRAVAKKAGVENYADAKINDIFLSTIRKAIQAAKDVQAELDKAEENLKEHVV